MPGGKGNIKPSDNPKPFNSKEGNKNINRSGANRKTWSKINKDLEALGLEPVKKETYMELIGRLMNADDEVLDELALNPKTPRWVKNTIVDLNESKSRDKIMSEYRDWMFGKATQKVVTEDEEGNTKPIGGSYTGKELLDALNKQDEK